MPKKNARPQAARHHRKKKNPELTEQQVKHALVDKAGVTIEELSETIARRKAPQPAPNPN